MFLILVTAIFIVSIAYLVHDYFHNAKTMNCYRRSASLPNQRGLMGNIWSNCFGPSVHRKSSSSISYGDHNSSFKESFSREGRRSPHLDSLVDDVGKLQLDREIKPPAYSKQFSALPPRASEICKRAWADEDSTEIFIKAFDLQITRRDLQTLYFGTWLNDEIVNFYLSLISHRSQHQKELPKVYAFNTFFMKSLDSKGYEGVRKWTKRTDIFVYDILLIPVHLGNHWCLAVIDFVAEEINYYDSLGGRNNECLDMLRDYLEDEHLDKKKRSFDVSNWRFKCPTNIPLQTNGSDCGVFTCCFAELTSRRKELKFDARIIPYYRQRMVYEIGNKKLL